MVAIAVRTSDTAAPSRNRSSPHAAESSTPRSASACARGELLGLHWEDVDLEAGTLEIIQTLQRVGGRLQFVKPKTADSERTIPLPSVCLDALKEHRKRQIAERADRYPDWDDHGLIFPSRRGTPMERTTCGVAGERFVRRLDPEPFGFTTSATPA
ncbi:hypothetical protein GCM10012289_00940 [Nonomuraea cavernae]|uniref:Tyr recombinase domain-containing protein n=1 Tax=Nonomuraea cavernae TaxID=2045107 RepID=A0A918DFA6_9ACTN|nr:hypothetical protein GCM10012289_00940 [Nonomuraea cavernae]